MYDYLFKDVWIADGTGNPLFKGNVAIFSKVICLVGKASPAAKRVIHKPGLVLSPGFIDIHSHGDLEVLRNPGMEAKLMQGITTDVNGNCGIGIFPLSEHAEELKNLTRDVLGTYDGPWDWKDFSAFKSKVNKSAIGVNMLFCASHSALRVYAMGKDHSRIATDDEIGIMCQALDDMLAQGCIGFSTGLYYAPCMYADERELKALLGVVKKRDALFAVHHRCEGDEFLESLQEVLTLAAETGVRLEISHLKAIGTRNQDKVERGLELIDEARAGGLDVAFDQYPYEYGSTSLFSLLPPDILKLSRLEQRLAVSLDSGRHEIKAEMLDPHGWDSIYSLVGPENLRILHMDSHKELSGCLLSKIAEEKACDPLDLLLDLLADETGTALMVDVTQSEENVERIMAHPLMGFGTDSLFSSPHPHIRTRDSSMHIMREYVSRRKTLTIEEAVSKMSGVNARRLRLKDRGFIKEGQIADLVIFDPVDGVVDTVMVNGAICVEEKKLCGRYAGQIL